jgi:hypothetical protein
MDASGLHHIQAMGLLESYYWSSTRFGGFVTTIDIHRMTCFANATLSMQEYDISVQHQRHPTYHINIRSLREIICMLHELCVLVPIRAKNLTIVVNSRLPCAHSSKYLPTLHSLVVDSLYWAIYLFFFFCAFYVFL